MTDQLLGKFGRPGENDISKLRLLTYNAFLDQSYLRRDSRESRITGDVNPKTFSILAGEACVQQKRTKIRRYAPRTENESDLYVFSNMAGFGKKSDTKEQMLRKLKWGGFKGYLTKLDRHHEFDTIDFTVYYGGLFSHVLYSDQTVHAGDLLYWDIPKDDKEAEEIYNHFRLPERMVGRGQPRKPVILRVYDPKKHSMNLEHLRELMKGGVDKTDFYMKNLRLLTASILALIKIAKVVMGDDIKNITEDNMNRLMGRLIPKDDGDVFESEVKTLQMGGIRKDGTMFPGAMQGLIDSIVTANEHVKSRVVARAVSSAAPGQSLDLIAL